MPELTKELLASWQERAKNFGADAARAQASWVTDGNDSDESRHRKLKIIEDDGVDAVIPRPSSRSVEWADGMSPRKLFEEVTGMDAHAEASWNLEAYDKVVDALCDGFDEGVAETFEDACVVELRRALGEEVAA